MQGSSGSRSRLDILAEAYHRKDKGERFALVTVTEVSETSNYKPGTRIIVEGDGKVVGTIGNLEIEVIASHKAIEALRTGLVQTINIDTTNLVIVDNPNRCTDQISLLIEPFGIKTHLIIFGSGRIAQLTARLADETGFGVSVYEENRELATPYRFPHADIHISSLEVAGDKLKTCENTSILVMTGNINNDIKVMRSVLRKPRLYLGVLGDEKYADDLRVKLKAEGFKDNEINAFYCPVGLKIRSQIPAEIAVAIIAQLISIRNSETAAVIIS